MAAVASMHGMNRRLGGGAAASLLLHGVVLVALLIGIPLSRPPEPAQETTVDMVFTGDAGPSMRAPSPGAVPAPADIPLPQPAPPAPPQSKQEPAADTALPPPPPPPPPPPQTQAAARPLPTPAPPPPSTPSLAPALPLPPPLPTPPPPRPEPPRPEATAQAQPLPLPPPPAPSPTSQPNPTKNAAPHSDALENTLEKLRALARQTHAPAARFNPRQGGAPSGGGTPTGNDTATLSAAESGAIGAYVRRCWTDDPGALDLDRMQVMMTVTTDASGVARVVEFAPGELSRIQGDARFQAFAERARRAVLDPACSNLPLPRTMLGKVNVLSFRFRP